MATYSSIKYSGIDFKGSAGHLIPLATSTFSDSSTVSFTSLSATHFDEHLFIFTNIHNDTDNRQLRFTCSTNGGSSYGIAVTSAFYTVAKNEDDSNGVLNGIIDDFSLGNSTTSQAVIVDNANDSDSAASGILRLYNLGSSTFVKHFLSETNVSASGGGGDDAATHNFGAGYVNTATAINAIQFDTNQGTFDGTIQLFGVH